MPTIGPTVDPNLIDDPAFFDVGFGPTLRLVSGENTVINPITPPEDGYLTSISAYLTKSPWIDEKIDEPTGWYPTVTAQVGLLEIEKEPTAGISLPSGPVSLSAVSRVRLGWNVFPIARTRIYPNKQYYLAATGDACSIWMKTDTSNNIGLYTSAFPDWSWTGWSPLLKNSDWLPFFGGEGAWCLYCTYEAGTASIQMNTLPFYVKKAY